jgi:ABC-type dipeptide/oligopeptide/nickel transport system ATPase subunit
MTVRYFLNYLRPFHPTWDLTFEQYLLGQFDLPLDRKIKHLSRGMKMKLALASVLAYRPALIVLDEPFSGLDPLIRDELSKAFSNQPCSAPTLRLCIAKKLRSLATWIASEARLSLRCDSPLMWAEMSSSVT